MRVVPAVTGIVSSMATTTLTHQVPPGDARVSALWVPGPSGPWDLTGPGQDHPVAAAVGAGLALPHQLWTGADLAASPLATAYWWGRYALALVAVLVFRLAVPPSTSWRHRLTVSHVTTEAPGVVSVGLGIAPLIALLQYATSDHHLAAGPITLIRRVSSAEPQPPHALHSERLTW